MRDRLALACVAVAVFIAAFNGWWAWDIAVLLLTAAYLMGGKRG